MTPQLSQDGWREMVKSRVLSAVGIAVALGGLAGSLAAQTPIGSTFDAASIKPNKSGETRSRIDLQSGGRFTATNVTLRSLIRNAYQRQNFQIVGGPTWIDSDRFDVVAKALEQGVEPSPGQLMIRSLLADRFRLVTHVESRQLQTYTLALTRNDRTLGPQLQAVEVDCVALAAAARRGAAPPPPPTPGKARPCSMVSAPGFLFAGVVGLADFTESLSHVVQRAVVDRTGLSGQFNIELRWALAQISQGAAGASDRPSVDPTGPSIFTALQEQLGLKLESTRGPVDVLVIDSAEHPTAN